MDNGDLYNAIQNDTDGQLVWRARFVAGPSKFTKAACDVPDCFHRSQFQLLTSGPVEAWLSADRMLAIVYHTCVLND